MIVYADVLIFLNTLVDYFLLLATARLTGERIKTFRVVLAAFLGGVSSLYIFLPQQKAIVEFIYKMVVAFLLASVCFKFVSFKRYIKNTGILFLVSCGYAGVMLAVWTVFKPFGMVINNSVVYLSISPTILVICSIIGYLLFVVLWRVFKKSALGASRHEITVFANGKNIRLNAITDTGNSLEDIFGKSEVIIADRQKVIQLFGTVDTEVSFELAKRYRLLPCTTVSGEDSLEAFRCDSAEIATNGKNTVIKSPLLAISKTVLHEDYDAIINPKILGG